MVIDRIKFNIDIDILHRYKKNKQKPKHAISGMPACRRRIFY